MIDALQEQFELTTLMLVGALSVGGLLGFLAERSEFCLRSAVEEWVHPHAPSEMFGPGSRTVQYLTAILVALITVQSLVYFNVFDLSEAVYFTTPLNLFTMGLGAILFGIGMVLAGGCVSRLLILSARGNLRSWFTIFVLSITAYATLSGVLAYPRVMLQGLESVSWPPVTMPIYLMPLIALGLLVWIVASFQRGVALPRDFLYGIAVGLCVPLGWFVTLELAADPFEISDPRSLSFTRPMVDTLQYLTIATGITPGFGFALIMGTLLGAFVSALLGGRLIIDGFRQEADPLRYALGGLLMGFGGILALGCSMGQGITGVTSLSLGSFYVLVLIVMSAAITLRLRRPR